jgi:hypothetical protein
MHCDGWTRLLLGHSSNSASKNWIISASPLARASLRSFCNHVIIMHTTYCWLPLALSTTVRCAPVRWNRIIANEKREKNRKFQCWAIGKQQQQQQQIFVRQKSIICRKYCHLLDLRAQAKFPMLFKVYGYHTWVPKQELRAPITLGGSSSKK